MVQKASTTRRNLSLLGPSQEGTRRSRGVPGVCSDLPSSVWAPTRLRVLPLPRGSDRASGKRRRSAVGRSLVDGAWKGDDRGVATRFPLTRKSTDQVPGPLDTETVRLVLVVVPPLLAPAGGIIEASALPRSLHGRHIGSDAAIVDREESQGSKER
jgi:hypothetical protein